MAKKVIKICVSTLVSSFAIGLITSCNQSPATFDEKNGVVVDNSNDNELYVKDNSEDKVYEVLTEGQILDAYHAELKNCEKSNKADANYTGDGYVKNINNGNDSEVKFKNIKVAESGCYTLYARYCTELPGASFRVYVKDDAVEDETYKGIFYGALDCSIYKTVWDHFLDDSIARTYINLEASKTYDIVIKGGYSYAELDYIQIGNRVGPMMERYEAEDFIEAGTIESESPFASNGHGAASITEANGVDFLINVPEDGTYDILINQCTGCDPVNKPGLTIYVDPPEKSPKPYMDLDSIYQTGWGVFDDNPVRTLRLNLTEGPHHLRMVKKEGEDNYVQIDYIDVKKSDFIRYEAEEGNTNATIYSDSNDYSGTGYVGDLNKKGSDYVAFDVHTPIAGQYKIKVCYTIGGGVEVPASFTLANNDGNFGTINCYNVQEWGHFDEYITANSYINLDKGNNIVTLFRDKNYAQIDYIEISETCVTKKDGTTSYRRIEAEDSNIMNACIKPSGQASEGNYVGDLSDIHYVEFPVYVAKDGAYEFAYSYSRPNSDGPSVITVSTGVYGNGDYPLVNFINENETGSSGWGCFSDATVVRYNQNDELLKNIKVYLKAGFSYIAVRPESANKTFELDYIEVGRRIGDYDVSSLGPDSFLYRGN